MVQSEHDVDLPGPGLPVSGRQADLAPELRQESSGNFPLQLSWPGGFERYWYLARIV